MGRAMKPKTLLGSAALAVGLVLGAGVADAQEVDTYGETPPQVLDDRDVAPPAGEAPEVAGDQVVAAEGVAGLPVTGGDIVATAVIGLGALGLGSALVLYRRRAEA